MIFMLSIEKNHFFLNSFSTCNGEGGDLVAMLCNARPKPLDDNATLIGPCQCSVATQTKEARKLTSRAKKRVKLPVKRETGRAAANIK